MIKIINYKNFLGNKTEPVLAGENFYNLLFFARHFLKLCFIRYEKKFK